MSGINLKKKDYTKKIKIRLKIKIFTYIDRYSPIFGLWLNYYKKNLPNAEITILFNKVTDFNVQEYLKKNEYNGINTIDIKSMIPFGEYIPNNKIFNNYQKHFLKTSDIVIYVDHDEFIVHSDLEAVLNTPFEMYLTTKGVEIVHNVDNEPKINFSTPIFQQRNYMSYSRWYDKPAIVNKEFPWNDGKHQNENTNKHFKDGLYLIHLGKICHDYYVNSWAETKKLYPKHSMFNGNLSEHYIKTFSNEHGVQPMIMITEPIKTLLKFI